MNPDKIRMFCYEFASQNSESWPPDEEVLANAFISYFELPPFVPGANLEKLCTKLEIQFVMEKLPDDLLGSNFHFEGKRRIAVSDRPERFGMKGHTTFHEIRELLEYEFHEIGWPTAEKHSEELESRADEFALCIMCGSEETWAETNGLCVAAPIHVANDWFNLSALRGTFLFPFERALLCAVHGSR